MNKVLTWDHQGVPIIPSAKLSPETLAAVAEVSEVETKTGRMLIKVKCYSKQAALDSLTRYLQMLDLEERMRALEEVLAQQRNRLSWSSKNRHSVKPPQLISQIHWD
jgi:hypothetical protein